jgi:hypothetical protein
MVRGGAKRKAKKAYTAIRRAKRGAKRGARSVGKYTRKFGKGLKEIPGQEKRGREIEKIGKGVRQAGKAGGPGKKPDY